MPQSGIRETVKSSNMAEYTLVLRVAFSMKFLSFSFFVIINDPYFEICIISVLVLLASTDYQGSS